MRYHPCPWRGEEGELLGWALWDDAMSPALERAGLRPYCSLDGQEIGSRSLTRIWAWLSACQRQGLDLGAVEIEVDEGSARVIFTDAARIVRRLT